MFQSSINDFISLFTFQDEDKSHDNMPEHSGNLICHESSKLLDKNDEALHYSNNIVIGYNTEKLESESEKEQDLMSNTTICSSMESMESYFDSFSLIETTPFNSNNRMTWCCNNRQCHTVFSIFSQKHKCNKCDIMYCYEHLVIDNHGTMLCNECHSED